MSADREAKRSLAIAFMRCAPTRRDEIARTLGLSESLPDRNPERSVEILRRVRQSEQIPALASELGLGEQ